MPNAKPDETDRIDLDPNRGPGTVRKVVVLS
jgi:hypothetical protein